MPFFIKTDLDRKPFLFTTMTAKEFTYYWQHNWPDTPLIGHYFKHKFSDRWFRIHSLPKSKRYPTNKTELTILLNRQNTILTDLLGVHEEVYLVTGEYTHEDEEIIELNLIDQVASITPYYFTRLPPIHLSEQDPGVNLKGTYYTPMFTKQRWGKDQFNLVLTDIANNALRVFFLSVINNCIVAPYDGGMDIILPDTETRDRYKAKYTAWLSPHESGL